MDDTSFENWIKTYYRRILSGAGATMGQGILASADPEETTLKPFVTYGMIYRPKTKVDITVYSLSDSYNNYPYAVFFDPRLPDDFTHLLWDKYSSFHPFDSIAELTSTYPVLYYPMMSQRGRTCSVDVMFTILFESNILRPLFYSPDYESMAHGVVSDDDCCIALPPTPIMSSLLSGGKFNENLAVTREVLRNQYIGVLAAAKKRYDRMMAGGNYSKRNNGTRNRRKLSVENTLWEKMLYPVKPVCSTTSLLRGGDIAIFFDFLLSTNGLKLPALEAQSPFQVNFYSSLFVPASIDTKNIIALVMLFVPAGKKLSSDSENHYIGMYRNGDTWFLVNNEVGYIHQIMDTDWVNTIMLPRLFTTVSSPITESISDAKDADKKLYAIYNSIEPLFTNVQFITFGERSYPNINPSELNEPIHFNVPAYVCTISKTPTATAASTGGGSAAATRRRITRRTRRRA